MSRWNWKVEEARELLGFAEGIDTFSDTPAQEATRVVGFLEGMTGNTVYLQPDQQFAAQLAEGYELGVQAKRRCQAARGEEPDAQEYDG